MSKTKSEKIVIEHLGRFFSKTDKDTVTPAEALEAWDRDPSQVERNQQWMANKLTHIRKFGYVKSIYSSTPSGKGRLLKAIKLTPLGKEVLGKVKELDAVGEEAPVQQPLISMPLAQQIVPANTISTTPITEQSLFESLARFKKTHPEYKITFNIELAN